MLFIGIISEILLYLCFSFIVGSFLLYIVPDSYRPAIHVPKGAIMLAVAGIAFFSFIPVLQLVLHLYQDIGLSQTLQSVLFTFEVGKGWIFTYILSNLLFIFVVWFDYRKKPLYSYIGIAFVLCLIFSLAWSGHASSLVQWPGFFAHTFHFIAVTFWVGILLVVSWFSKKHANWLNFLKWFTPVAFVCFVTTIVTGLVLMTFVVDLKDYTNAWVLSYGQSLLIKHLLIIPLLVYAVINSLLMRKKLMKDIEFNPKPWTKAESIVILLIFSATAALGQESPPHNLLSTLQSEGPSKLFTLLYQGIFQPGMSVYVALNVTSITLLILALLFLALTVFSFIKKSPAIFSFLMSVLFVCSSYLSLILSIKA
ncbi:hypothetical protein BCI9360_00509 [Bacillus sp. CECT 9360]|nr:hypothetical protein BCI9360_00509 [Bacillus sp. CECT 9360]